MPLDYSIQAIGSPFGNYGLGGYNAYSSYYPSFVMGMMPGLTAGMGMMPGISGMPGVGVYNTETLMKMQQEWQKSQMQLMRDMQLNNFDLQKDMQKAQLQHDQEMHDLTIDSEIANQRRSDRAFVQKSLTGGEVDSAIENLYHKVREGDCEGVVEEFNKAKAAIYATYGTDLAGNGAKTNYDQSVIKILKDKYAAICTAYDEQVSDLESDIKKYCEGAGKNGFMQGWHDEHSKLYAEEVVEKCFGRRVNNKDSKDLKRNITKIVGSGAHVLTVGVGGGFAAGATAYTLGKGALSVTRKAFGKSLLKFKPGQCGRWGLALAAVGAIADVAWKVCND